ncbi:asparagine synthase-related protein [Nocardia sp. NPDC019395]|uniref:asparagine synthase-related protein n=1 Tax=Nocardia sp. NPDC019395 TaxID=3154686 RepID=UPI0033C57F64
MNRPKYSLPGAPVIRRTAATTTVQTSVLGGQPFYAHHHDANGWHISQSLADITVGHADPVIDAERIAELRSAPMSSWPDGLTSFIRDVHVLDANSTYHFTDGDPEYRVESHRHEWTTSPSLTPTSLIEHLTAALQHAQMPQSPLLFLSGGLDSAVLAVVMADRGIDFDAICIFDGHNADDVDYATALATELGLPFSVHEFDYNAFISGLPRAVAAFSDPRPDLFFASGLLDCLSTIGPGKYRTVIGGEPADALLGGLRTQVTAVNDRAREAVRTAALRTQIPRDIAILEQASATVGADATCPYGYLPLASAAMSTSWPSLLDAGHAQHPTGELGGPGYKILQAGAAQLLPSSELRRIATRTKRGLPSSAATHWRKLQSELSEDPHDAQPMLELGVHIYEQLFVHGLSVTEISVEESISHAKGGTRA